MKRLMKYTAVVLATLTVLYILWQFRLAVVLFILSLFMAAAIRPSVEWLASHGLPKRIAQPVLYLASVGGLLLVLILFGDLIFAEVNRVANSSIIEYEALIFRWQKGADWQQSAANFLPAPFDVASDAGAELSSFLPMILNVTRGLAGAIGGLLLLFVLSIYWSADQYRFERLWLSLLSARRRAYARDSWRAVESAVGNYLRSQAVQSVVAALTLMIGALVAGFPFPFLLAVAGAAAAFVPLFGGFLAALAAFGLGILTQDSAMAIAMAAYTLVLFLVIELFVEPRLWTRRRQGFFMLLILIVPLSELFGVWGLLIAAPLAAALETVLGQLYQALIQGQTTVSQLDDLRSRSKRLAERVAEAGDEELSPDMLSLIERLDGLIAQLKRADLA